MSGGLACAAPGNAKSSGGIPLAGGWTARFYVSPTERLTSMTPGIRRELIPGVNAQLSRPVARDTRVTVDVLNAFDRQPSPYADSLLPPHDGRGMRLGVRVTFR